MEDSQVEHVGMFVKVKTFLNKKAGDLASTPVIAATLQPALISQIDLILEEDEDASAPITGSTELKRNLRTAVEDKGFTIAAACAAYYTLTVPNPVLRVKCEFQQSDFDRMRDKDVYVDMSRVHEIADPVKALLAPFGVAGADVDALGTALTDFFAQFEAPFDARGERAASGKQVDRLIEQTLELLKDKLDVVMKFYVTNNPELHDYYLSARAIDQTGGGPIPDEDEQFTLASGQFMSPAVSSEMNANSHIVLINKAGNGSQVIFGFSNFQNGFSGVQKTVMPGTTSDDKAIDLGFTPGIPYLVFQNPGNPNPVSIDLRGKVFY